MRDCLGLTALKALAKAGCGITFLYETAVREELAQGALIPNLRPLAVASDRIFFQATVEDQRRLYQVELEREDLELVSVMAVSAP